MIIPEITTQINRDGSTTIFNMGESTTVEGSAEHEHVNLINEIRKLNQLPETDKFMIRMKKYNGSIGQRMGETHGN